MGLMRWLIIFAAAGFAFHWWQDYKMENHPDAQLSANGFVSTAMPASATKNSVLILAPVNCPSEAAQRANALSERLTRMGVPNVRGDSYSLNISNPTKDEKAAVERAVAVLNGEIPAVFINGMGKANPTADEVLAEYQRTR